MYSTLNVPFKSRWSGINVKEVDFLFNIGTIEAACDRLGIEFWQMAEHDSYDFTLALLYEGYLTACRFKFVKPKYTFAHAVIWLENMSRAESQVFAKYMAELMGKVQKEISGKGEKKK